MAKSAWFILAFLIAPLAALVLATITSIDIRTLIAERARLGALLGTSSALAVLTALIAVPLGTLLGVILSRLPVRGRSILQRLVVLGLFVPLPVVAIAWQIVLGNLLPPLSLNPGEVAWRPWNQGLLPAAFVHAAAALPWVIVIVMACLQHIDRDLEEEAIATGGPRRVFRRVLGPKLILAMVAATAWISVQTATEIPVTDAMMVRTFAEEVYTQIVGGADGIASAVALTLPVLIAALLLANTVLGRVVNRWPTGSEPLTPARILAVPYRNASTLFAWGMAAVFAGLPFFALVWKAGGGGATEGGSITFALRQIGRVISINGTVMMQTLLVAITAGIVTAALATILGWWARGFRLRRRIVLALAVILALTPGPLIGLGLKALIFRLIDLEAVVMSTLGVTLDFPPLRSALYDQPSPLPYVWACVLRFLPVAFVIIAPVIRTLPRALLELAQQDGVSTWTYVGRPLILPAARFAVIAVAGLSLGEVSSGKLVLPPGCRLFVLDLFDQMHYGTESTVAAMALVQIGLVLPVAALVRSRSIAGG